jgi:hypothetical protein
VARAANGRFDRVDTNIKNADGDLLESAIPSVSIVKDGGFYAEEYFDDPSVTADLKALVAQKLGPGRLAGFVIEGLTPYGTMTSSVRQDVLQQAIYCGLPVALNARHRRLTRNVAFCFARAARPMQ